ncbi:MAG: hypothetical protein WC058_08995 [Phycisphaeraceae bacterium]
MSKPVQAGLTIAISMLAFGVHLFWYIWTVPYHLWQWSGGIEQQGIWTRYGLSRWAWTIPCTCPRVGCRIGPLCPVKAAGPTVCSAF